MGTHCVGASIGWWVARVRCLTASFFSIFVDVFALPVLGLLGSLTLRKQPGALFTARFGLRLVCSTFQIRQL